jgi:3-deoxy-D-arabino-heptulosonate 7-phosphate (DAHP) synthase
MITLQEVPVTSIAALAMYPPADLQRLKQQASENLTNAKNIAEWIDAAIQEKYSLRLQSSRQSLGKTNGVINLEDDGYIISEDLPKKIDWDQHKLSVIYQNLQSAGDKPEQYIDISYNISEKKYSSWPEIIRERFTEARELKSGRAKIFIKAGGSHE